jgi:hypothetical protein
MEYNCKNYIHKYKCDSYCENHDACKNCELAKDTIVLAFSRGEIDAISGALEYLLGAELLPENGYTDDVVSAINSALTKVQEVD